MKALYDYRNRVYSPDLGRFLQTDPIRFTAGDVSLYRYVGNNAVNFVDPEGLQLLFPSETDGTLDFDDQTPPPEPTPSPTPQPSAPSPIPPFKPSPNATPLQNCIARAQHRANERNRLCLCPPLETNAQILNCLARSNVIYMNEYNDCLNQYTGQNLKPIPMPL